MDFNCSMTIIDILIFCKNFEECAFTHVASIDLSSGIQKLAISTYFVSRGECFTVLLLNETFAHKPQPCGQ